MNDLDDDLRAADPLRHPRTLPAAAVTAIAKELALNSTVDDLSAPQPAATSSQLLDITAGRARPRRRRLLAAALTTAVLAAPTAAVAVGALPGSPADVFAYWRTDPQGAVDPASATRAGTAPGPDGRILTVLRAQADDRTCLAAIFEKAASGAADTPVGFRENGSTCWSGTRAPEPFGRAGAGVTGTAGAGQVRAFHAPAGDAVRADLHLADGTVRPALLVEGYFFGWFSSDEPTDPVLIGHATDGAALGTITIPTLR